jgi:hypothetical protein
MKLIEDDETRKYMFYKTDFLSGIKPVKESILKKVLNKELLTYGEFKKLGISTDR